MSHSGQSSTSNVSLCRYLKLLAIILLALFNVFFSSENDGQPQIDLSSCLNFPSEIQCSIPIGLLRVMCESGHLESESGSESTCLESESTRIRIHLNFLESESESGFESDTTNVSQLHYGQVKSNYDSWCKQIRSQIQIHCIFLGFKSKSHWVVFESRSEFFRVNLPIDRALDQRPYCSTSVNRL